MYADKITPAMKFAIDETNRRRETQAAHNEAHGVVPRTVQRPILDLASAVGGGAEGAAGDEAQTLAPDELPAKVEELRKEMYEAAAALDFEKAAQLRDRVRELTEAELLFKDPGPARRRAQRSRRRPRR